MIVKRDGRREEFSKEKLLSGVRKACQKRPSAEDHRRSGRKKLLDEITDKYDREVPSMGHRGASDGRPPRTDEVAYVRFASVYRRFQEAIRFRASGSGTGGANMIQFAPRLPDVSNGRPAKRSHAPPSW